MSIKTTSVKGGLAIAATMALATVVAGYNINQIRLGGPIHNHNQDVNDFVADILPPPQFLVEPFLEASRMMADPADAPNHIQRLAMLEKQYHERADYWAKSNLDQELKDHLRASNADDGAKFWQELDQKLIPAVKADNMAAAQESFARLDKQYDLHREENEKIVASALKISESLKAQSDSTVTWTIAMLIALGLGLVGVTGFALRFVMRRVLDPLDQTAQTMSRMAGGDLQAGVTSVHRSDEIGDMTRSIEVFRAASIAQVESAAKQQSVVNTLSSSLDQLAEGNLTHRIETEFAEEYEPLRHSFNGSVTRLSELMRNVAASAQGVSTGAGEIRAASDDLALRNEQQAASLEETAAAMNQVTQVLRETADNAAGVRQTIEEAHHEASDGGAVVKQAIEAMAGIERSSQEISQIISVIDGIAFQTNLLALNAGVEAARAGDAGKGFAVVANEVRALAQRSADAAKDIKSLITASTQQVGEGVTLVGETGTLLEKIVVRVGEIAGMMSEIATSTENQSVNLQQVNSAVGDMDRMTQQNAAMVEQSTAAARSLADEAAELNRIVSSFRVGGGEVIAAPVSRKPAARRTASAPPPMISGNLALKSSAPDDDWSEF